MKLRFQWKGSIDQINAEVFQEPYTTKYFSSCLVHELQGQCCMQDDNHACSTRQ
jgi:hypothetical protein